MSGCMNYSQGGLQIVVFVRVKTLKTRLVHVSAVPRTNWWEVWKRAKGVQTCDKCNNQKDDGGDHAYPAGAEGES